MYNFKKKGAPPFEVNPKSLTLLEVHITYEAYYSKNINGKKYLSSFNFKIKLKNDDQIKAIKVDDWGLDLDYFMKDYYE